MGIERTGGRAAEPHPQAPDLRDELLVGVEIDDLGGGRTDRGQRRADDRVSRGRRGGRPVGVVRGGDLAAEEVPARSPSGFQPGSRGDVAGS